MLAKAQLAMEKEGLLTLAMFLFTTGGAIISKNLPAGITCIIAGVAVVFIRGYFKVNGRWKFK